jgi:hypothetical protein
MLQIYSLLFALAIGRYSLSVLGQENQGSGKVLKSRNIDHIMNCSLVTICTLKNSLRWICRVRLLSREAGQVVRGDITGLWLIVCAVENLTTSTSFTLRRFAATKSEPQRCPSRYTLLGNLSLTNFYIHARSITRRLPLRSRAKARDSEKLKLQNPVALSFAKSKRSGW